MMTEFLNTPGSLRHFLQEALILEVTEKICAILDRQGISREELGRRLGMDKDHVEKLLDGQINLTIRALADIFTMLGYEVKLVPQPSSILQRMGASNARNP